MYNKKVQISLWNVLTPDDFYQTGGDKEGSLRRKDGPLLGVHKKWTEFTPSVD